MRASSTLSGYTAYSVHIFALTRVMARKPYAMIDESGQLCDI